MRILHIANDEKFIDSAIKIFEKANPHHNIYLINGRNIESLIYINSRQPNIEVHPYASKEFLQIIEFSNPDIIFFHNLSNEHRRILKKIGRRHTVFCKFWGKELYTTKLLANRLYKSETKELVNTLNSEYNENTFIKSLIKKVLFKNERIGSAEKYLKFVDYVSAVVKEDFELLEKYYPKETRHLKYFQFNYGGILPEIELPVSNGENILIGNSGNFENNHLESFALLKDVSLRNRIIYVPLSYGGNKKYIQEIIHIGNYLFGDKFKPITQFLPFNKYDKVLESVGFAIMNHSRQHAMGNILNLLYRGATVFMDYSTTSTKALLSNGITISDITSLNPDYVFTHHPILTQQKNKEKIINLFSFESLVRQTQILIEEIMKDFKETKLV